MNEQDIVNCSPGSYVYRDRSNPWSCRKCKRDVYTVAKRTMYCVACDAKWKPPELLIVNELHPRADVIWGSLSDGDGKTKLEWVPNRETKGGTE